MAETKEELRVHARTTEAALELLRRQIEDSTAAGLAALETKLDAVDTALA